MKRSKALDFEPTLYPEPILNARDLQSLAGRTAVARLLFADSLAPDEALNARILREYAIELTGRASRTALKTISRHLLALCREATAASKETVQ